MRTWTSRPILLLALALAACGDASPPALTVGAASFSEDQLLGLSPTRRATLAHLTALGLAVADSSWMQAGEPLIRRWKGDRRLEILAAELTLEKNGVTDPMLEARYLTDPEYELTVRHILFFSERWRTDAERAAAKAKAERALAQLRDGADFAETAAQLSEEPGAESRAGLLTPGRKGSWVDEFWAAASALEVGDISPVTETQYGYHILRLEGREVVPFAEARGRVAREVAHSIEDPDAVLAAWLDGAAETLEITDAALEGAGPTDASATLATWPGGTLTVGDYLAWETTQPASWNHGGRGSDPERFRNSVMALARRRIALAECDARGLALTEADEAEQARRWDDLVYRWSATLGFRYGLGPAAVGQAALAALSSTAQGATITRDEVDDRAPLLVAAYPVSAAGETAPGRQP